MGYARFDSSSWKSYTASRATRSRGAIFTSTRVPDDLNPAKFTGNRESRDSAANQNSNAIIIAADVTGSMGMIAEELVRKSIGTTFEEILKRAADPFGRMISDPHLMVMGIGDVVCDNGPVQATQFETDLKIAEETERIWLEGGGGGNASESYDAVWYMAAQRTSIDCFEKRNRKGYLFTVGDEEAPYGLSRRAIKTFFGDDVQSDLSPQQLLAMAEHKYHVFHIIIEQGSHASRRLPRVQQTWRDLLGQRVISLPDFTKLAEAVISAIQVNEGMSLIDVAKTWSGDTSLVVAKALGDLKPSSEGTESDGLVRF